MKDANLWLGIGALVLAALTLILNFVLELYRAKKQLELKKYEVNAQREMKRYEVEFLEKRKSYVELFGSLRKMLTIALNRRFSGSQLESLGEVYGEEAAAFYGLIPFLPVPDHTWAKQKAGEMEGLVQEIWHEEDQAQREVKYHLVEARIEVLRRELFDKLFGT